MVCNGHIFQSCVASSPSRGLSTNYWRAIAMRSFANGHRVAMAEGVVGHHGRMVNPPRPRRIHLAELAARVRLMNRSTIRSPRLPQLQPAESRLPSLAEARRAATVAFVPRPLHIRHATAPRRQTSRRCVHTMPDTVTRAAEHELVQADGFAQLKVLRRANGTRMASASTLLPSPLHLDICVLPSYESLSRSSSWQDLTVYATEAKKMRAKDFFPPVLGDEDFRRRQASHPGTFIKTPTTQAFHTHDQERGRINPFKEHYSAMSPTTIDKKILVTENDLKLFSPKRQLEENPQEAEWGKPQRSGRIRRIRVYSERRFHPIHSFRMQMPKVTCKTPSHAPPLRRLPGLSQQLASDLGESRVPALRRLPASTKPTCQGAIHFRKGQATIHARPAHRAATPSAHKERGHKPKSRPVLAPAPVRVKTPKKIGIYSPEERRKRIERFLEKRKHRVFHKRVKYDCRKRLANACPRHKGRFARREVSKDDEDGEASDQKTDSTGE